MSERVQVCLGGVELSVAGRGIDLYLDPQHQRFASRGDAEVRLMWRCGWPPAWPKLDEVFDSGDFWRLGTCQDQYVISYRTPVPSDGLPSKAVFIDRTFERGTVYLHPECKPPTGRVNPLSDRLDELLVMHRLACGLGVLFHACCVYWEGRGMLFLGHSGAGKSTLARLWARCQPDAEILSDECTVVRKEGHQYFAYGTPWHGTAECALPIKRPLSEVYIIEHAAREFTAPVHGALMAGEVLARAFIPHWIRSAVEFSVGFLSQMLSEIRCRRFGFRRRDGAVEFLCDLNQG
jgi:hypothetical protein